MTACSSPQNDKGDVETIETDTDTVDVDPCAPTQTDPWQILTFCRTQGQLLSVWGRSKDDVWVVGAGGQVLHFNGCQWTELDSGSTQDLWWVYGFDDGSTYIVGALGTVLRHTQESGFVPMEIDTDVTLFGIWGSAPDDIYSIGFVFNNATPGGIFHYDGSAWTQVVDLPDSVTESSNFFKVWGTSKDDVWAVGRDDLVIHWDGTQWTDEATGLESDWVTINGRLRENGKSDVVMVGGKFGAKIMQRTSTGWADVSPDEMPLLQGVCMQSDGAAVATGMGAALLTGAPGQPWTEALDAPFDLFSPIEPPVEGCVQPTPDYHGCWGDGDGNFFVVGGNFLGPLSEGVILHYGDPVSNTGL
ncbi:MAG TPA: hypothetical protein EYN66_07535 [Myxococcales bacterium]|nr:hypothetical protein [Myxococcales bacterium]